VPAPHPPPPLAPGRPGREARGPRPPAPPRSVAKLARSDDDQWVRVVAAAVGDFRGPLSITSLEALPVVRDTIGNIERLLEHHEAAGGGVVVPEAAYLSPYAAQCAGLPRCRDEERTSHFEARESRVPPFVPLLPSRGPTAAASGEGLGGASGEMGNRGGVASGRSAGESLGLDDDGLEWEELSMGEGEGAGRMSGAEGGAGNSSGAGAGASGGYGAGRGSYNPGSLGSGPMVKRPRR